MTPDADRTALLRRHMEAENRHQLQETLDTLAEDCVFEDVALDERLTGHAGAKRYYERWWPAFPDLTWQPAGRLSAPAGEAVELVARGTHRGEFFGVPATGRPIELRVAIFVSVERGQMTSERLYYDVTTLLSQLGVEEIPPRLRGTPRQGATP